MVMGGGIVIERALRRPLFLPNLQRRHLLVCRQVESPAGGNQLLDRCRVRPMEAQALRCFSVPRANAGVPEEGQIGSKATLRASREAVGPSLGGNVRRVALGDR